MTTIDQDRLARLLSPDVHLRSGKGRGANGTVDLCVVQATDWLVGGTGTSDAPKCVDPCLRGFAIKLNDSPAFAEWRDELKPFAARLANTNQGVALTKKRAFACADWAVREIAPLALEKRHPESAARLRAVPEIVDDATALAARSVAQAAAAYAPAPAYAYAYAAADAAAYAAYAADAAAYDAAASAAASAAAYAAADAADAAASAADAAASAAADAADAAADAADAAASAADAAASAASDAYAAYAEKRPVWDAALAFLGRLCDMSSEARA